VPRFGGKGIPLIGGDLPLVTKVRDCASARLTREISGHGFDEIGIIHSTLTYMVAFDPIKIILLLIFVEPASISAITAAIAGEVGSV
jgi:hypothetical protein